MIKPRYKGVSELNSLIIPTYQMKKTLEYIESHRKKYFSYIFGHKEDMHYLCKCTSCNSLLKFNGLKPKKIKCTVCGIESEFKNDKQTNYTRDENIYSFIDKTTAGIVIRTLHVVFINDVKNFEKTETYTLEIKREFYNNEKDKWNTITNHIVSNMGSVSFNGKDEWRNPTPTMAQVLNSTLVPGADKMLRNTKYKYVCIDKFKKGIKYNFVVKEYLEQAYKYHDIELISKFGYGSTLRMSLWSGIESLKSDDMNLLLRFHKKTNSKFAFKKLSLTCIKCFDCLLELKLKLPKFYDFEHYSHFNFIMNHVRRKQEVLDYLVRQNLVNSHTYYDYIRFCVDLGLSMNDDKVLFPDDLQQYHDILMKRYNEIKDQEKAKHFKQSTKEYQVNKKIGKYIIKSIDTLKELQQEGKKLHHCVGSYADNVIRKESKIYAIRKVEEPSIPFYTLELSNENKFRQCRTKNNGIYTDEIKKVVDKFIKNLVEE